MSFIKVTAAISYKEVVDTCVVEKSFKKLGITSQKSGLLN